MYAYACQCCVSIELNSLSRALHLRHAQHTMADSFDHAHGDEKERPDVVMEAEPSQTEASQTEASRKRRTTSDSDKDKEEEEEKEERSKKSQRLGETPAPAHAPGMEAVHAPLHPPYVFFAGASVLHFTQLLFFVERSLFSQAGERGGQHAAGKRRRLEDARRALGHRAVAGERRQDQGETVESGPFAGDRGICRRP